MQKELLRNMVMQNQFTSSFSFNRVSNENAHLKLNDKTASIGFIFRHIAETINLFPGFFGVVPTVQNTTIGKIDENHQYDVEESRALINNGFKILERLIEDTPDEDWLLMIDTPFFGKVTRIRLFSHILFHNSHHAGQISMTLAKGS